MTLRGIDIGAGLLAVGHIAAWTLLGVIVHDELADTETTSNATPDVPLSQLETSPEPGAP
jgi:hypothetical protein